MFNNNQYHFAFLNNSHILFDFWVIEPPTNETLCCIQGICRVCDSLTFCRHTCKSFSIGCKSYDWWSCASTFRIFKHLKMFNYWLYILDNSISPCPVTFNQKPCQWSILVRSHLCLFSFHDSHTRICGSQVDSDNMTFDFVWSVKHHRQN